MANKKGKPTVVKDLKDLPGGTKPDAKGKPQELPGVTGPGVEPMSIPTLDKFIVKYETAKAKRCAESPGELQAKKELKFALHQQAASLPVNAEGFRFYRSSDYEKDYTLEETLKVKSMNADAGDPD
jgi:hypothetical protein